MAELRVDGESLHVDLSGWERVGALQGSGSFTFPLSSIRSVSRLDNARRGIRGLRSPGTGWPGVIALGTWRAVKTKDFVAVYRNHPGYSIELTDEKFDRIVVSSPPIAELDARA